MKLDSSLPARLQYLRPFADFLASLDPDEIDESVDPEPLFELIEARQMSVSEGECDELLAQDAKVLAEWLLDRPYNVAHFILPFFEPWAPAEDLSAAPVTHSGGPKTELPRPELGEIEGLEKQVLGTSTMYLSHRGTISLIAQDEFCASNMLRMAKEPPEPCDFGEVTGQRFAGGNGFLLRRDGNLAVAMVTAASGVDRKWLEKQLARLRFEIDD